MINLSDSSPVELARQVAIGQFSPEACSWLRKAFFRHISENEGLESALKLDRVSRIRQRNEALREAARLLRLPSHGDRPWPVAERLAVAVKYFLRLRRDPQTNVEIAIAKAFSTGQKVPSTARQLYELLK